MRPIAIICPGPSLLSTWSKVSDDGYQRVIAVNRAAELGCDWWYAQDLEAFDQFHRTAQVRVGLATWHHNWDDYERGHYALPKGLQWISPEVLPEAGFRYLGMSMLGAMGLAVHLGARVVEIFGCDWSGTHDYVGGLNENGRQAKRWADERADYERLCNAFHHITFIRHRPIGAS